MAPRTIVVILNPMAGQIVQLRADHFEPAMAFLNRCFGESEAMDFASMLPTRYQPTQEMQRNYALMGDGHIQAMVGLFPIQLWVGDVELRMAAIGGVSVAPEYRGQGLMRLLMGHVAGQVERQGYDLGFLSGARHRYRHFGWDIAGTEVVVELKPSSPSDGEIHFEPIEDSSPLQAELKALHDAQPIHCARQGGEFIRFLRAWHRRGHAALNSEGKLLGYLVASPNGNYVPELVAKGDDALVQIATAWARRRKQATGFVFRALPSSALFALGELAEKLEVRHTGNWRIFDFVKVVDAAMRLRHRLAALPEGQAFLSIPGQRDTTHLEVRSQSAGCAARQERDGLALQPMQAMRLLFGPWEPGLVTDLGDHARALQSWCPLPLGFSEQDRC